LQNLKFQPRRYLRTGELETLLSLAYSVAPLAMLEFGVNEGLTARAALAVLPTLQSYQGIDVPRGYKTEREVQRGEVPVNPGHLVHDERFELIVKPNGSLDLTAADLKPCDVAFIDGDHGRRAVTHDTALARALVRPGGMIIWHDYNFLDTVDVTAVLHEFAAAGADIKNVADTWLAFERV
jgi:predicted O-methyltransferase YrrM